MVSETGHESGSLGLEVDLLGGFAVRVAGRMVPATAFSRRRARTLLAVGGALALLFDILFHLLSGHDLLDASQHLFGLIQP